jgi:hypothetical protein
MTNISAATPAFKEGEVCFVRVRVMKHASQIGEGRLDEWICFPVGKDGRDTERGGAIWAPPEAMLSAAAARAAVLGGAK